MAPAIWERWFVPFLNTLQQHQDAIKAFSYINTHWPAQPMWKDNPVFQQVDSRIEKSPLVSALWKQAMQQPRFLQGSEGLRKVLGGGDGQ